MTAQTFQLDYAKPPQWHRRREFRWTLVAVAMIAVAASAWRSGPEKWERAKLLYWQWRCMNYTAPPDEIVYDQDPAGKSRLLNSPQYIAQVENHFAGAPITAAVTDPDCEVNFVKMIGFGCLGRQPPILFLHERVAPSGHRYLIIVRGDSIPFLQVGQLCLDGDAFVPGNWRDDPQYVGEGFDWSGPVPRPTPLPLRIYAGQSDPKDLSHFTIAYEENGKKKMVDGFVTDDLKADQLWALGSQPNAHVVLIERPAN